MARRAVLPLSLALAAGPALAQVPQQPPPAPPPAPGAVSAMTAQPCPPDRDPLTDWP